MSRMSAEDKKVVARMKEIRELIKEFGLSLSGYDPGISAYVDARPGLKASAWNGPFKLDDVEWTWLEPLLKELWVLRKTSNVDVARVMKWLKNPKRKPAGTAFTEGPDRQAAYWAEMGMAQGKFEMARMF